MRGDEIRILLVEDDEEDYQLTSDLLRKASPAYAVEWSRDFESARNAIVGASYDVCLVDYHLGKDDGIELIATLQEQRHPIPMIVLTGDEETDVIKRASAAGASDYISKNELTVRQLDRSIRNSLEREKIAARKRESAELLSSALNALAGRIAILDEDGKIIAVNDAWRNFAALSSHEDPCEIGDNYFDIAIHGGQLITGRPVQPLDLIRDVVANRIEFGYLEFPCARQGSQQWYGMRITRFLAEESVRIVISLIDITERKATEDEAQRLAAIVESSADAIIGLDLEGRVITWNRAAEKQYGRSVEEVFGMKARDLEPPEHRASFEDMLGKLRAGEIVQQDDVEFRAVDGTRLVISRNYSPVYDRSRRVIGISRIDRDMTHQKNLEQQVLHSQKIEAVGQLTGGIAHDFNNILTVVNGHAETLKQRVKPGEPGYKEITEIAAAGLRAAKLTQQLLAFGRKQIFKIEVVEVDRVVTELRPMLERLLREDIILNLDLCPGLPTVEVDVNRMEQVLVNLVINARDAMPSGGRLDIRTSSVLYRPSSVTQIDGPPPGPYVVIMVEDTGVGIPKEILGKVFEPFFTTKEVGKGTGLGLSTVHGIVKQSGGHVSIESTEGKGTVISILLPASEQPAVKRDEAVEPCAPPELRSDAHPTILVAEDDESVRE